MKTREQVRNERMQAIYDLTSWQDVSFKLKLEDIQKRSSNYILPVLDKINKLRQLIDDPDILFVYCGIDKDNYLLYCDMSDLPQLAVIKYQSDLITTKDDIIKFLDDYQAELQAALDYLNTPID